jgi:hypothetical protein
MRQKAASFARGACVPCRLSNGILFQEKFMCSLCGCQRRCGALIEQFCHRAPLAGVGKTTAIREVSRLLADSIGKRVVICDTSNEIGGDGDVPHPGIGRARRMQVASAPLQHEVMIEAVENHMPQVCLRKCMTFKVRLSAKCTAGCVQLYASVAGIGHTCATANVLAF